MQQQKTDGDGADVNMVWDEQLVQLTDNHFVFSRL